MTDFQPFDKVEICSGRYRHRCGHVRGAADPQTGTYAVQLNDEPGKRPKTLYFVSTQLTLRQRKGVRFA